MNFIQQLMSGSVILEKKKNQKRIDGYKKRTETMRKNTFARYRLYLEGVTLSTMQLAAKLGLSSAGCMSTLIDLEAQKKIVRVPGPPKVGKGRDPVYWTWNKNAD